MQTINLELFKFDELSDDAKEKARDWWRSTAFDFAWNDESRESIEAFVSHFGARLVSFGVAPYESPDYSAEYFNSHFRGMKLRDFKRDFMPTGYCLDCTLWETFYDNFKLSGDAKAAFDLALWEGFKEWRDDMEHQLSDEYIDDVLTINEYSFLDDGTRWSK